MKHLVNFRSLGGYKNIEGKKVQANRIFRSGEVVGLDDEDRKAFTETYKIGHIYDFRGDSEIMERPDEVFDRVAYNHIDIMKDLSGKTASLSDLAKNSGHPDEAMMVVYEELVMSNSAQKGYQQFLLDLVDHPKENSLFHCFAGKDRTGVGAALIYVGLGVDEEVIYEDYLKTNIQRKKANDIFLAEMKKNGASPEELTHMETMLYVKKAYLNHALDLAKKNFGSLENYLIEGLKLPKDYMTFLRQDYLEQ